MAPYTYNHQRPAWSQSAHERGDAPVPMEPAAQMNAFVAQQREQAARAVMHPDHSDPDWRYYFGALTD